ncbi:MAG: PSD1 and planctomycete cytochrome C domain-containing protein [Planctomycetes bacterium]|nr:PSD1 and planctomycete cytochrome C domain-containing protein [Planctomycetota bacterium]MCH9727656.1 PSD1 and planctomycete cytochrome C domain-containing protein [Planctomycetota bacterium]MCH9775081.1 PSD1 and planctomycete cytochrome C domain-containing protein [Planctomycetota bacterium]MCH9789601.1 PSD1 and planctomycete cytochrome C domain-containing protein [Planctomycetota bacterium]
MASRNSYLFIFTFTMLVSVWNLMSACAAAEQSQKLNQAGAERLFTLKVLPLLKVKCFGCHGNDPKDIRGDYNLLTREAMLKGTDPEQPPVVPGDPENSPLYQAVLWNDSEMPPKENDRLSKTETEYIRRWITAGAPWPDAKAQLAIQKQEWSIRENEEGIIVDTTGGLANDWTYRRYRQEDIWAFQPLKQIDVKKMKPKGQHPIDYFIQRKIDKAEIKAAPEADARTLIRRATYDLTGLPPSPKEVFQFDKEWKKHPRQAWSDLVNGLLKSEDYGERWAQHWLDVVRYSDTAGFSNDYERSNAWRYRDYVIRSFNKDKPYNEFVKEQIAGDELRPGDPEATIATGFLRMGPWGTAMIPQKELRQIYLDDLVHNVGQSFLSIPMRCCKCHDHKFDPIPTHDYYSMYAAFATTQPAEMQVAFLPEENRKGFTEKRKLVEELFEYAKAERDKVINKQETAAKKWYAEHNLPYKNENARKKDPEDKKPPRHVGLTPEETGIKKVREQDVWIWERRLERYEPMAQAVYNGQDDYKNGRKLRPAKKINRKWRPENFILAGGSLEAPSQPVSPGVLSATGLSVNPQNTNPYRITDELSGRRLALAEWIASDKNPLTARSIVNRVWQHHFGKGLVKTANNFGAKGGKPTHPELLNWLTADFIRHGWKLKRLHKLIMSSKTYRRSSTPRNATQQATIDPNNQLLASFPPRRLTAEELRDSALLISGELNRERGGVPIMPEMNMEVALQPRMIQFSIAPAHQPSRSPAERNRRTIYAYRVRGQADPFLEIMNLPNPNESCEVRNSASVSPQAFTLLNSETMTDRSIAFAQRVQRERKSDTAELIHRAVQLAYSRIPTPQEQENLERYLKQMQVYHRKHQPEKVEYPTQIVRSLVEEFTGERFEFIEKLNVYENYVPDAKPWTVDADTRALADVCLLLLNSNEFLFVY